jgi:hypothetical protein
VLSFGSNFLVTNRRGQSISPILDRWQVESVGPVRLTMSAQGTFTGMRGLRLRLRESFFHGTGLVRLEVTLHNSQRARHRGGLWDLGDRGSTLFEDLSLYLLLPSDSKRTFACSTGDGKECQFTERVEFNLYQDSSGGENWRSLNHVNRNGKNVCRMRGYVMRTGDLQSTGYRASPTICVSTGESLVAAAFPEFWQTFPKAISLTENRLRLAFFPQEFDDLFELQGGEQKTHTVWLKFGEATGLNGPRGCQQLEWVHRPMRVQIASDWYEASGALPIPLTSLGGHGTHLELILDEATCGPNSIPTNREKVDEYGWRNYGDVFADHEQLHYRGAEPLVSHYNNQFDMLCGFLIHYLRTGNQNWWEWGHSLARHILDIDIYHTTEDKSAYNGGLFWFTDHYLHARTSTHRTYSRHNRTSKRHSYGGGPSPEHNFTTGLLLHYCLTGNSDSRDAVLSLAEWVIAMDDGRRTIFGWIDDSPTGRATGSECGRRIGRAAGNSINALLDAWLLSGSHRYLDFAENLIQRCIHPSDNVESLNLLDVESHWSYTVFLRAVLKYLDAKEQAGQLDTSYEYARLSVRRFAMWMLQHEIPYFDQIEKLEFPTEAWAAQEFRKANVLRLAARLFDEPTRTNLLNRGNELGDRAWSDLLRFETRASARALAIVMIEGLLDCTLRSWRVAQETSNGHVSSNEFSEPIAFVSQLQRVKALARHPAAEFTRRIRRRITVPPS